MSSKVDFNKQLKVIQVATVIVCLGLAIAAGVLIKNITYQITVGHLTNNLLASQTTIVFAPATHSLFDLNIRWTVVFILVISAILPLLWLTRLKNDYSVSIGKPLSADRFI